MFYDNFIRLCEDAGVSPSRVLTELNISKGSLGRWKSGGEPLNETKKKIADYFGITVRELMEGKIKKDPAPVTSEEEELQAILEDARRNPDLRILFSLSRKATPKEVKKYIELIKLMSGDDLGGDDC